MLLLFWPIEGPSIHTTTYEDFEDAGRTVQYVFMDDRPNVQYQTTSTGTKRVEYTTSVPNRTGD